MMISFYPGPSRVYDEIPGYVKDACRKGILSINHRSDDFMTLSRETVGLLKAKLDIPEDYTVFYTSSATECWEIVAQSLTEDGSAHIFNGAFGKKWFEYARKLRKNAKPFPFDRGEMLKLPKIARSKQGSVLCLTQNETSNGTQISNDVLEGIRQKFPQHLIAVDATSSMAGVRLNFKAADVWFASVQKCFGLPAGLGLMFCSPSALEKVRALKEKEHYNSLSFMMEMMEKWQTPFTPNVLNIYLLNRVLRKVKHIDTVNEKIVERYHRWMDYLQSKTSLRHLIDNDEVRSYTVIPVTAEPGLITAIKARALKRGILLGEGYGDLKSTTFRIANFPAIRKKEIRTLMDFLSRYE